MRIAQVVIFCCYLIPLISNAEYIPNPPLLADQVQPYCQGGCLPISPISVVRAPHTYDPEKIPIGFDEWPLTVTDAAKSGYSVAAACIPEVGRIATFTADPRFPMQLRYDSGGYLAGWIFISANPQNFPFELRFGYWAGYADPLWVADLFWRDPADICTDAVAAQISK